eukprot:CAMPEP_0183298474 /NCGR_PEP_ID=MMETSP0160_2-20130417/5484_1 /TAXON_ID=2839 ORGANISM="Odontella Sinensis, Strain Grunow 1884" /NCGR_SAMPLE_ID=MMETSP0160_2 /ASSEMBLY_ACC=CAM_ASM_000250 /LENGTH=153 /DNA_ID=CAMNT_0025460517 /DNA_START=216 /DNA_END=677 /DNA_ORIENTATION=-
MIPREFDGVVPQRMLRNTVALFDQSLFDAEEALDMEAERRADAAIAAIDAEAERKATEANKEVAVLVEALKKAEREGRKVDKHAAEQALAMFNAERKAAEEPKKKMNNKIHLETMALELLGEELNEVLHKKLACRRPAPLWLGKTVKTLPKAQ